MALEKLSAEVTPFVERLINPNMHLPNDFDARHLARATVLAAAPAVAGCSLVMLMLNLWLAGRVAQLSAQLPRPWPDIARELRLPQVYLLVFGAAAGIGPFFGGLSGHIVVIVAVTLGVAFALDGLAVAHYLSRGSPFRIPLLILIYLGLVIPVTWLAFLLLLVLTGIIETAFSLRDRKDKTASPKL